jgi:trimethylamine--corrinoid protein Co-methyltransferase
MLDGSMLLCPEQVILDHEVCLAAYNIFNEYEFEQSDLALDVIKQVGPGSHFLRQKHTRQHIRDFRLSPILRQKESDGSDIDPRDAAIREFKRLDEGHHPEPLPDEVLVELDRILAAADREAANL